MSEEKIHGSSIFHNGRLTVPVKIRRLMNLKAGDQVEFVFEDDRTIMRPVASETRNDGCNDRVEDEPR